MAVRFSWYWRPGAGAARGSTTDGLQQPRRPVARARAAPLRTQPRRQELGTARPGLLPRRAVRLRRRRRLAGLDAQAPALHGRGARAAARRGALRRAALPL